ncbi:MAG: hypothetical protein Q8Q94_04310 [bacterium]|nr:hypothetical protein [bacterium]MDZ4299340.1 hypothetical protein [Candidatus Sungbacteria bacterium]
MRLEKNMIAQRQKSILDAVIREHIRTARPVASQDIRERYRHISPATIRHEMSQLDEEGYLEQPHTSAGRVPTDEGYRSFVDRLTERVELPEREQKRIRAVFTAENDEEVFVRALGAAVLELTGSFVAAGIFDDAVLYDLGFSEVLAEPEFREAEYLESFGRLIDELHQNHRNMAAYVEHERHRVFIGHENPMREARQCAMMLASWHHPRGFSGFLTILGPRRMDYRKNLGIMRYLEEEFGE